MKNKSLVAIYLQGLLTYSIYQEEPQIEHLAPRTMPQLFILSQPLHGNSGLTLLPMN